jgi:hypothetical protein
MTMHVLSPSPAAPAAPLSGVSVLAERAVLASPSIRIWTARKFDKRVTADVTAEHGAAADAGRWNKSLVSRDALTAVTTAASRAREYHYQTTLPWSDDGARILPTALYLDRTDAAGKLVPGYASRMREFRTAFDAAVADFVRGYPDYVEAARERLNGMFNAADYPAPAAIAGKFDFAVNVNPVPSGRDFRVEIGDAVRADVERRVQETTAAAMADACKRVAETIGTMADKLAGYVPPRDGAGAGGVFRDSLVSNVRDLAAVLPAFNLTGSPEFDRIAARVADLARPEADQLRTDDKLRRETAEAAAALAREAERIAEDASAWF